MREIKFRGYAVEEMVNSQWLEGFGVLGFKFAEHYAKEVGRDSDWWIYTNSGDYRVDPKSIGQYTGLKDKNGKEIYEGDIVRRALTGSKFKVYYSESGACYRVQRQDGWHFNVNEIFPLDDWEIIGNIYENPSLLEEFE